MIGAQKYLFSPSIYSPQVFIVPEYISLPKYISSQGPNCLDCGVEVGVERGRVAEVAIKRERVGAVVI